MSLIARPSVLFLDEPTTGLDPRSRLAMWDLIEGLVAEGMTTLLTTQYLDEAERLADEIVVIDNGTVIERGTPGELKERSGGERVEVTLADVADLRRVPELLAAHIVPGTTGTINEDDRTICLPVANTEDIVPAIVRALDDAAVGVRDVVVRRPTLDDVFLELTGHGVEDDLAGDQARSDPARPATAVDRGAA
jgi:ABC-2 type transport system ATP-binding protein